MVIAGDFKVELVDAQTKEPFPEHTTNDDDGSQTYVEVKQDIEYYISYERMTANNTPSSSTTRSHHQQEDIIVTCSVDGKDLGWAADYFVDEIDYQPNFGGSWDCTYDCTSYQEIRKKNALHIRPEQTTSPTSSTTNQKASSSIMISGKVEFQIWMMGSEIIEPSHSYQSDFATTTSSMNDDDVTTTLSSSNSTLGSTFEIENVYVEENCLFEEGLLLETITLNYCTKDWLINAGILLPNKPPPPPDTHDHQDTMKPVLIQLQKQQQQQKCNRGKRSNTGGISYELFDLTSSVVSIDYSDDFTSSSSASTRKKDNSAATSIRRLTNAALSSGSKYHK